MNAFKWPSDEQEPAFDAGDPDYLIKMARYLRPTRPSNDRNQGRKPIKEGQATVSMTIRLTAGQREKLTRLGGAAWIRDRIDMAKIPVDSQK